MHSFILFCCCLPRPDHPECFTLDSGADYRGTVSQTISGLTCQAWNEQTPHRHGFLPDSFPGFGLGDHNYCRSLGRARAPWCFTTDPETEYEYCSVGQIQSNCRNPGEFNTPPPHCCVESDSCLINIKIFVYNKGRQNAAKLFFCSWVGLRNLIDTACGAP